MGVSKFLCYFHKSEKRANVLSPLLSLTAERGRLGWFKAEGGLSNWAAVGAGCLGDPRRRRRPISPPGRLKGGRMPSSS